MSAFDEFKFVQIPFDESKPILEISKSKEGGLEKDELQLYAKSLFSTTDDEAARYEAFKKGMEESGQSLANADPRILQNLAMMGASVEICTLGIATPANGYIGVSMYCDSHGQAKNMPPNKRATDLARACGHISLVVRGDAFIGRCYDNEEEPWLRLDFNINDTSPNADWVIKSAIENSKRNMNAYSSSGAADNTMKSMLNQQPPTAGGGGGGGNITQMMQNQKDQLKTGKDGIINWNQDNEEIELKINNLPSNINKKMIKINFKRSLLNISIDGIDNKLYQDSELCNKLINNTEGLNLFGTIVPDECTWCLSSNELQITLTKSDEMIWNSIEKVTK